MPRVYGIGRRASTGPAATLAGSGWRHRARRTLSELLDETGQIHDLHHDITELAH